MIMITQWLCPLRHTSIGLLWDKSQDSPAEIVERGEALYREGTIARWCEICGSRDLKAEHLPTRSQTIAEAEEDARKIQAAMSLPGPSSRSSPG